MSGSPTLSSHRISVMTGLLSSTALTLSLVLAVATPVLADDLTYDESNNNNQWDLSGNDWINNNGTPNNPGDDFADDFDDGDAVVFDDFGNTVTITQTVAPGSIFFTESPNLPDRIDSSGTGNLNTDQGTGGILTIDLDEANGNLFLDVDITGSNDVVFGSIAPNAGSISITDNATVAPNIRVSGGRFALIENATASSNLSLSAGLASVSSGASVVGTTNVTGGTFTNGGDTGAGGGLLGAVNISGSSLTATGTLSNQSAGDIVGLVTVNAFGVLTNGGDVNDLTVAGGSATNQGSGNVTGAVNVTGGILENRGDIGTTGPFDPVSVTGGVLRNEANAIVRGDVTVSQDTIAGTVGTVNANGGTFGNVAVQTGGIMNINDATTANVTVAGGTVNVTAAGTDPIADPAGRLNNLIVVDAGSVLNDGTLAAGADVNTTGILNNRSTGLVQGTLTTTGTAQVFNSGDLTNLAVGGGTVQNERSGDINGNVTITTGLLRNLGDLGDSATDTVTITGGILNNTTSIDGGGNLRRGTVAGTVIVTQDTGAGTIGTLNANGGNFNAVTVQTGGVMNVNDVTAGAVTVSGGTVNVTAAGTDPIADPAGRLTDLLTVNTGTVFNGGNLAGGALVTGTTNTTFGTLNNQSSGTIGGTITVTGFGDVNNGGTASGVTLQGGTFENQAAGDVTGAVSVRGGTFANFGELGTLATAGPVSVTGGTLNNQANAFVRGNVTIGSNITPGAAGIVNANGGTFNTVDVQTGGQFNLNVATDADVRISGGTALISTGLTGTLDVTASTASVTATGTVSQLTTVSGGTLLNAGNLNGGATASGTTATNFGTLSIQSGAAVAGTTTTTGFGRITNGGRVAALNVQGGTFTNQSAGDVTGAVTVTGGTLVNTGDLGTALGSGPVSVTGGTLNNNLNGTIFQTVTLNNSGTLNMNGGTFAGGINAIGGTLNINNALTQNLTNSGTTIRINGLDGGVDPLPGQTGSLTGTITNATGSIETFAGATVSGLVTLSGGNLTSAGGIYTTGVAVTGGTAAITGNTAMGQLTTSAGTTTIQSGATLTAPVINSGTGLTTNNGIINGAVTVQGGTFAQSAPAANVTGPVQAQTGGRINASGGSFDTEVRAVGGNVTVTGPVTGNIRNAGAGEVSVATGGTLTGALNADLGTFRVAGTLNGALNVAGATGVVTGVVENTAPVTVTDGTLITRGTGAVIRSATTVSNATLRAEGGTFSGGVTLNTAADMQVLGRIGGTITNVAGNITVTTDGDVAGTLNQNGATSSTTVSGTISGRANVNGGTLTSQAGSTFDNAVNVDGGTLVANGGRFTGGVDAVSGAVDVTGTVTGDLRNAGGDITVANTGNLAGTLTTTSGTTTNNGTIAVLNANGGTTTQAGGTVSGLATAQGGVLVASGGTFAGGLTAVTGGRVDVTGTIAAASFANNGGQIDITATGTLTDTLTHSSGTTTIAGSVAGLVVEGSGITTQTGASITEATTVTAGGVLVAQGGSFAAPLTNTGGRIDVNGPTSAAITNQTGLLIVHGGANLTGSVTNQANMLLNGTVTGTVANNAGTLTVAAGQNAAVTAGLSNADGATVALAGTLTADVTNAAGGIFNLTGGTLNGGFDNFGDMTTTGTNAVSGASTNAGDLLVQTGSLTINDSFENSSGNTTTINAGTTLSATSLVNTQTGRIINNGTLAGALTNAGQIETTNGITTGLVTNNGTITGVSTFAGGLRNNGTVDLTGNATAGDILTVSGAAGLSGTGIFALDIDLSSDVGGLGASDYILAEAGTPVTGTINLAFNLVGIGGEPTVDIPVVLVDENAANNFTVQATGLPDPGEAIIFQLTQPTANGDVFVSDLLNPGIGALAGSIVLTQSLIGSVINRPSSPYVIALAYEDENPCGAGGWARLTGGSADSNGQITQEGDDLRTLRGEISADFYGLQVGGDFACFNSYFSGWDLAGGGIAGFNEGRSNQPVFALDSTGGLSDRVTSVTDVDFRQTYAGIYGTAVRDRFAVELQYRVENTAFTATNEGRNGSAGLGLTDSQFDSDSNTFSGSASYVYSIPDSQLSLVPLVGFAYTQIASDPIVFDDGSVVQVEDFTSQVGFVGGTLSRTKFGEDGTTAMNQFVTATYYNDFAADPRSVYTDVSDGQPRSITTENLGDYTEISAGLNYVKILDVGNKVDAKQLSASVRGDIRLSDQLESWGLTAQMRIQF